MVEPMPGHEMAAGRLSIPYLTPAGVVAVKFRAVDDDDPKYLGPSGQKPRLFNTRDLFRTDSDTVVLCEGELDAVVCSTMVGLPSVAIPGVSAFESHWPRCFADFERVVICFDNDDKEDGSNPGLKASRKWVELFDDGIVVPPPKGMDINEWYVAEGRDAVRERLLG